MEPRTAAAPATDALAPFHPAVARWFRRRFGAPTEAQARAWPRIRAGEHVLLVAPTGSGKTLAAFLAAIERVARSPAPRPPAAPRRPARAASTARRPSVPPSAGARPATSPRAADTADAARGGPAGVRVLYVSPLKALDNDVRRNLEEPLRGVAREAATLGGQVPPLREVTAAVRTGDTPPSERVRQVRRPPDILITTPESLFLLLTSPRAQRTLATVETVIVDEIHALAGGKRGTHLAVSLERLERLTARPPQRVGLSATVRPADAVAAFLGGRHPVTVLDCTRPRPLEVRVSVPVPDFRAIPGDSIWHCIASAVLADVRAHRTTLVFVGNRASAESLTRRLNALAGREVCRAHHGSVSRQARQEVEAALKAGALPALCTTGTLELGIDVGAIDYVVMVGSPGSVARGLQRIGRSGHAVGETSAGRIICRTPVDLAEAAVLCRDMCRGHIEPTRVPLRALDVLAQHLVSLAAAGEWRVADLLPLVRAAAPYRDLTPADLDAVLELLSGRYPAERFAGLRARLTWDREAGVVRGRPGSARAAAAGAGTIPDRGLFPVFGPDGQRLGELDEEFVHESRRGDLFVLGTTTWRISAITPDRVLVTPGAGGLPRVPFWHGDGPGRSYGLGCALAAFFGEAEGRLADEAWWAEQARACRLEPEAVAMLRAFVREQAEAGCLPTDRRVALECYPDPLGDLRLCVHAPFGRGVTEPWSIALRALLRSTSGVTCDVLATDDGVVLRLPRQAADPPLDLLTRWSPAQWEAALREELPSTPLFAARFRECAARALLLERGSLRRRLPLWLQRLRAADLLAVARRYPNFPIVREALRECLHDHFDLPAWRDVLGAVAAGGLAVRARERPGPSPLASAMEFRFKAEALYEKDAPRAEAGAAALAAVDGAGPDGPAPVGAEAAEEYVARAEAAVARRLHPEPRSADELHDLLLRVGPLPREEAERGPAGALDALLAAGRATCCDGLVVATEELTLWRAASAGEPEARARLTLRWLASVPAASAEEVRARFGWAPDLEALPLEAVGGGRFAHPEVRRLVRRRALALARAQMAPVPLGAFAAWVRARHRQGGLADALGRLQGVFAPVAAWLRVLLPARVPGARPGDLERLVARGEFVWVQRGGDVAFFRREAYAGLAPPVPAAGDGARADARRLPDPADLLRPGAALWFADLRARSGLDAEELDGRLRALAAAGVVSNDSLEPLLVPPGPRRRAVGGRWWALPAAAPCAEAWVDQLLARYGVVARLTWDRAAPPLGWPAAVAVLRRREAEGALRRGYFVRGLGGLQFARAADLDALRASAAAEAADAAWLVAGLDPVCLWREAPRRAGSFLVVWGGAPALAVAAHGRRVYPLRPLDDAALAAAAAALRDLPAPRGRVEVAEWDGRPVLDAPEPVLRALRAAGFARGPATLRWRQA